MFGQELCLTGIDGCLWAQVAHSITVFDEAHLSTELAQMSTFAQVSGYWDQTAPLNGQMTFGCHAFCFKRLAALQLKRSAGTHELLKLFFHFGTLMKE